ncbi:hypothetical protein K435DRAFT_341471 [Dendrothele bispora CBS 962.96]|uniref:Uncharacterized protein n=1 Tax=Dendrothele bispora (strain CBS 962.96) TaxID=1314807 RepID=A0A4S8LET5_DENBC|nr:hypothetical protein K435DRAFT_341471 [Dendrothele bispora CBS 962.96]
MMTASVIVPNTSTRRSRNRRSLPFLNLSYFTYLPRFERWVRFSQQRHPLLMGLQEHILHLVLCWRERVIQIHSIIVIILLRLWQLLGFAGTGAAAYAHRQKGGDGGDGRASSLVLTVVCSIFKWIWWVVDDAWEIGEGKRGLWTDNNNNDSEKEEPSLVLLILLAVRHQNREGSLVPKGIGVEWEWWEVFGGGYGGERSMFVHNPDLDDGEDKEGMRVDGVRKSRRMYLPGAQQGASGGRPAPRDNPNTSVVMLHRDGERVPKHQQPKMPEGPEEILPTYVRLVLDGRPRNGRGGSGGEGGASGSGQRV